MHKLLTVVGLSVLMAGCVPKATTTPGLLSSELPTPAGQASAVALLLIRESPLEIDGEHVGLSLTTFGERLTGNTNGGCVSDSCKALHDKYGHRQVVADSPDTCTVAFIGEHTIITAGHCITGLRWSTSFVMLGQLPPTNSGDSAQVPVSQFARLECVHGSEYDHDIPDWAVIEVSPVGESLVDHATLSLQPQDPCASIVVQSYMLRLALQHETERLQCHSDRLRFTNAGGGSGAPLIQGDRVVGVVSGNDTSGDHVCNAGDETCAQYVTWSDHILELLDRPSPPRRIYDEFQPPICPPSSKESS